MMPEEMQARAQRRQHFVDDRLAGVDSTACGIERSRGLVGQQDIDVLESFARDDFVADEVPTFIVAALSQLDRRRAGAAAARRRQCRCRRVVPTRRERSSEYVQTPRSDLEGPRVRKA